MGSWLHSADGRGRWGIAVAAAVLLLGIGWVAWRAREPEIAQSATYVGASECASCHTNETAQWERSQHFQAMQVADSASVKGDFDGNTFTDGARTSTFFRRGGKFLVRTDGPDGTLQEFGIRYTFGVDPLQQYLIELQGGRIQPLSIAWDTREKEAGGQRWFHLYPGEGVTHTDELHWSGRGQNWNFMCADCHSTNVRKGYDAATDQFRTTWSEMNVSCEACHGPGSRHVSWAERPGWLRELLGGGDGLTAQLTERAGVHWEMGTASGTARRSVPRQNAAEVQVCAQCHSRRSQIADGYQAGGPLLDHYLPALLTRDLYYADGQQREEVYSYGSFLQSRMFHAGVTCADCHDPHTQALRAPGNQLCAQCHSPAHFDTGAHTFHAPGTEGSRCVSCHMPATTYMQIDARRDHSIRIPRPDQSVALGVPNACTRCHAEQGAAWAAERVRDWYGDDPRGFQNFAEAFAADDRDEADAPPRLIRVVSDSAQPAIVRASALARLAANPGVDALETARASLMDGDPQVRRAAVLVLEALPLQQRAEAAAPLLADPSRVVRIQVAATLAPAANALAASEYGGAFAAAAEEFIASQRYNADRPESRTALGTFYTGLGRAAAAEAEYGAALRLAPGYLPARVNLADLYASQGREASAERVLREGLAVSPDAAALHHALGLSLARSGHVPRAVAALGRAAELAPDVARFAYAYAVALHSSGRVPEAIRALDRARERHPRDRDLLFALATFSRDANDQVAARRYAELLFQAHPDDTEARTLLESFTPRSGP